MVEEEGVGQVEKQADVESVEADTAAAEQAIVPQAELVLIIEALLLSSDSAISIDQMLASFEAPSRPDRKQIRDALHLLDEALTGRAVELREVATGWRVQVRQDYAPYIGRLWEERPPRYSRALLETLALIVYRQPISRGEIEEIRGVSLSQNIIKTLMERDWVKVVGVREAPGRPELLGTTKIFLDDFNLKTLSELPSLPEIRDPDALGEALARLGIAPEEELAAEEGDQADLLNAKAVVDTNEAQTSETLDTTADDFEFGGDDNLDDGAESEPDIEAEAEADVVDNDDDAETSPVTEEQQAAVEAVVDKTDEALAEVLESEPLDEASDEEAPDDSTASHLT